MTPDDIMLHVTHVSRDYREVDTQICRYVDTQICRYTYIYSVHTSSLVREESAQTEHHGPGGPALCLLAPAPAPAGSQGSLLGRDTRTGRRLELGLAPATSCLVKLILNWSGSRLGGGLG